MAKDSLHTGAKMAQWKISGGYDYALLPNRECNQKQKHKKQPWEKAESPNDFAW
ncbi:MAG: hypothetical protein PUH83_06640 [Bacteroidales bacterium]|nr:hypothetical protein [Bacteroidales bacterium]MDY5446867.1 hypothetical protein [Sodaliphilus sp.]